MSFFSSTKEETCLVLDIGSGTLGGALIRFKKDSLPDILYTYREPIVVKRDVTSDYLTESMLKTLNNVCGIIVRDGLSHITHHKYASNRIDKVFYVFSSPWVLSQTKIIHVKKEKEILVTHDFVDNLIKSEEKPFQKMIEGANASESSANDMKVIEQNIVGITLNGYESHDPFMKKAKTVDVPFFVSVSSGKLIEKLDNAVHKAFHFKTSTAHSCILLSFLTLRDIFHDEKDFIFIDIHGELTDLSVTKNGILIQTASFPIGVSSIVRTISDELSVAPQVAESYIKMFLEGKCDDVIAVKMKGIMNKIKQQWIDSLHLSLENIRKETAIPQTLFLTVGNDMEKFFSDILSFEKIESMSSFALSFKVIALTNDVFSKYGTFYMKSEKDAFLSMHTIALNKLITH